MLCIHYKNYPSLYYRVTLILDNDRSDPDFGAFLPIIGHDKFFCCIEQQKYKLCYVRFLIKCRFK